MPWLDAYADAWRRTRRDICLATNLERRWDDPPGVALAERAEACMDEGRDQFEFLVEQMTTPREGAIAVQAVRAASDLPRPSLCIDEDRLRRVQTPPERDEARRLRKLLARAATLESVGDYKGGLALAEAAQRGADALGWGPLRAAAALARAQLHDALGDYEAARVTAEEALLLAGAAAAEDVAADAAGLRAWVVGLRLARFEEGVLWSRLEAVLLDRAGVAEGSIRRARYLNNTGAIYFNHGAYDEAKRFYERALALREAALGPEHPDVANTLNNLGNVYGAAGSFAEAEACFSRTLEIRRRALGPGHPDIASSLNNLGNVYKEKRELAAAERLLTQALEIRERALGADHPQVARTLGNLGEVHAARGAYAAAGECFRRSLKIQEATLGADHPSVAASLLRLGTALAAEGAAEEARQVLERARELAERSTDDPAALAETRFALAQALWPSRERRPDARALATLARDAYREAGARRAAELADVEAWLASH
jgi:tetratricopeptide (TPR) repeat protein